MKNKENEKIYYYNSCRNLLRNDADDADIELRLAGKQHRVGFGSPLFSFAVTPAEPLFMPGVSA